LGGCEIVQKLFLERAIVCRWILRRRRNVLNETLAGGAEQLCNVSMLNYCTVKHASRNSIE
jgi:hypothetical protein